MSCFTEVDDDDDEYDEPDDQYEEIGVEVQRERDIIDSDATGPTAQDIENRRRRMEMWKLVGCFVWAI